MNKNLLYSIYQRIITIRPMQASIKSFVVIVLMGLAVLVRADNPNKAGVVIVHGDGAVTTHCVEFDETEIDGLTLLYETTLPLSIEVAGVGATVCSLDNEGCNYPAEACFCQCLSTPCYYWSYWHLEDDGWNYSNQGASIRWLNNGDVDGWVWGEGNLTGGEASEPPDISFADICETTPADTATPSPTATTAPTNTPVPPTSSPTASATNTATATATHTPTPTPTETSSIPTDTPTPKTTPIIYSFTASKQTINLGETVILNWDLSEAQEAYLHYNSQEEGVVAPGTKTVAPEQTTVYTLIARNKEGGQASLELTITVNQVTATPLPTATHTPTSPTTEETEPEQIPTATATFTTSPTAEETEPEQIPTATFTSTASPPMGGTEEEQITTPTPTPTLEEIEEEEIEEEKEENNNQKGQTPTPLPTPIPLPTSTPNSVALLTDNNTNEQPPSNLPQVSADEANQSNNLLLIGVVLGVVVLFLVLPLTVVIIGGLIWWLWKRV